MSLSRSRQFIFVLLVALVVGAGSLLVAGSALASTTEALFRIEQRWHGAPTPPVTVGGAGMYQAYLFPYWFTVMGNPNKTGAYELPPATAVVQPFNPKGGAFSLPQSFFVTNYTDTLTPKTNWPGYTTYYQYQAYNGPGKFEPNFGRTGGQFRMVFPTTYGNPGATVAQNPTPNYGTGNPIAGAETTTFGGRYDQSRNGSLFVTPGANRFGGTFRLFNTDVAHWEQWIEFFPPNLYYGYGFYHCMNNGKFDCTPGPFASQEGTTQAYDGVWWLLTASAKAPGSDRLSLATVPRTSLGTTPTMTTLATGPKAPYVGDGTPSGGPASYSRREQHYLNFVHPWTTGKARAVNAAGVQGTGIITPQATGFDLTYPLGTNIAVKKFGYNETFNKTLSTFNVSTTTPYTQFLTGVTRVVSMVRPRMTWTMNLPLDPANNPVTNIWAPVRMKRITVYFLPEPGGMLALGVGIASLLGLSRLWRR